MSDTAHKWFAHGVRVQSIEYGGTLVGVAHRVKDARAIVTEHNKGLVGIALADVESIINTCIVRGDQRAISWHEVQYCLEQIREHAKAEGR